MSVTTNILLPAMRLKPAYKTVTWLTIALYTPLAVLSFSGQVLCVGEDNHMQVESTGDSCCGFGVTQLETSELMGDNQGQPGCGDCSDVDLAQVSSILSLLRPTDIPKVAVFVGLVWSITATPSTNCMGRQAHWDEYLVALTQPQLIVSTTILIC